MKKKKVKILEIIRQTPGGYHSWVKAKIGKEEVVIKKENKNIPDKLFKKKYGS